MDKLTTAPTVPNILNLGGFAIVEGRVYSPREIEQLREREQLRYELATITRMPMEKILEIEKTHNLEDVKRNYLAFGVCF